MWPFNTSKTNNIPLAMTFSCPKMWDDLTGDGVVRHCEECHTDVYDLRGLNEAEMVEFIKLNGGKICGGAFRKRNGKVVNGKCLKGFSHTIGRIGLTSKENELEEKILDAESRKLRLQEMLIKISNKTI